MTRPPTVLREAAAWRELAEMFARRPMTGGYVCHSLAPDGPWWSPAPRKSWPRPAMLERANMHVSLHNGCVAEGGTLHVYGDGGYWNWMRNDARVIFCLLMALECEDEAR